MIDGKLLSFVQKLTHLIEQNPSEEIIFVEGKALLEKLISVDDWLPEEFTKPHPQHYQQYLLYADPLDRFSVVSFVFRGPCVIYVIHVVAIAAAVFTVRMLESLRLAVRKTQ